MPFDPLSAGVAGAGMVLDFIKSQQARKDAQANQEFQAQNVGRQEANRTFQLQNLYDALFNAQRGRGEALNLAGGLREDQFGNATYYDPQQGRWITSYSPSQQRLIEGGVERQGRAQARGAQASQDYDRLRGEYLYQKPKSEAESFAEIVNLLNQAQGTGERQLNTLMDRWGVRTAGNLPQLTQLDRGPTPGQQLAETMLKARGSALDESLKRQAGHTSQYLPALKQFEDTANYVAPIDPTGSGILSVQGEGQKQLLGSMSDYDKLIAQVYGQGGQNINAAGALINTAYGGMNNAASLQQKADAGGPGANDFLAIAKMLMPGQEKVTGTLGGTKGATYSGSSSDSDGNSVGSWDRRFNFGPTTKGVGGEAARFGGERAEPFSGITGYDYPPMATYSGVPDYGNTGIGSSAYTYDASPWGQYATGFGWKF